MNQPTLPRWLIGDGSIGVRLRVLTFRHSMGMENTSKTVAAANGSDPLFHSLNLPFRHREGVAILDVDAHQTK